MIPVIHKFLILKYKAQKHEITMSKMVVYMVFDIQNKKII